VNAIENKVLSGKQNSLVSYFALLSS